MKATPAAGFLLPGTEEEARRASLVSHEGSSDPRPSQGCDRWPPNLRLRSTLGELVAGRCKATNLCLYCARLAAVENSELLQIDSTYGNAPEVWVVLTTPSTSIDPRDFYEARRQFFRALKRRWPACEYAALLEFTTGYGTRSEGKRRPHWNILLKGIPGSDVDALAAVVAKVWCPRVGGRPEAQWVGHVQEFGGLMRYIALHFQKESQAPPADWRGQRFTKSAGYLWTDTAAAREEARAALRLKREIYALEEQGLDAIDALEVAEQRMADRHELAWELVRLQELPIGWTDGLPSLWRTEIFPV